MATAVEIEDYISWAGASLGRPLNAAERDLATRWAGAQTADRVRARVQQLMDEAEERETVAVQQREREEERAVAEYKMRRDDALLAGYRG